MLLYAILSVTCAGLVAILASVLKLRGRTLRIALERLVGDRAYFMLADPRLRALASGDIPASTLKPAVLASALVDTYIDDSKSPVDPAEKIDIAASMEQTESGSLIRRARRQAAGDPERTVEILGEMFRQAIDEAASRYGREIRRLSAVVAALVVVAPNVSTFAVADQVWKDDAVEAAVIESSRESAGEPPAEAAEEVEEVDELGLQLGWSDVMVEDAGDALAMAGGWLVTIMIVSVASPLVLQLAWRPSRPLSDAERPRLPR